MLMATSSTGWSLQARVQLIALLTLCIGLVVGSVSMYHAASMQDDEVIDERVELLAKNILQAVVADFDRPHQAATPPPDFAAARPIETGIHHYQIWTNNGTQLLRSYKASRNTPFLPVTYTGYREILLDGIAYCVYSAATSDRSFIVQVAEPTPKRKIDTGWLVSEYLAVALIPFSLILLFNRFILRRSFQQIEAVARNLNHRSPADARQIEIEAMPREIEPLVISLNDHLQRMGHALSVESRFTSIAAHELRTPLAGIRAQAQLATRASNPEDLRDALNSVLRGVDASSRVIEQLIDLHRIESLNDTDAWRSEVADLDNIRQQLWSEYAPRAKAKNIKLTMAFDIAKMRGHEFAILTLMRNLIGNALQYTPVDGKVDVRIKQRDFRVVLRVDDSGPGIPAKDRQHALEKFDRLGRRGTDGVGLGLSIVSNVATLHQAVVDLRESLLGGLQVEVQFHGTDISDQSGKDQAFLITTEGSLWNAGPP
jgi:signal transduction histidine kinase